MKLAILLLLISGCAMPHGVPGRGRGPQGPQSPRAYARPLNLIPHFPFRPSKARA